MFENKINPNELKIKSKQWKIKGKIYFLFSNKKENYILRRFYSFFSDSIEYIVLE